jgi:hypothetical protein
MSPTLEIEKVIIKILTEFILIPVTVGGCPEGDDRGEELGPGSRRSDRKLCPDERRSPTRRYSFGFRTGNSFSQKMS